MSETDIKEIKFLIQDAIREMRSNPEREQALQELKDKIYVTQAEALRHLERVGIRRGRFERLVREGKIRMKDKEDFETRNSGVRYYAVDIYKILTQ